jgi:histone H3/H4
MNLTRANEELFRRVPDECFSTFDSLWDHCQSLKEESVERWHPPTAVRAVPANGKLDLLVGDDGHYRLNDWSFLQLCKLASVSKDTVNRLTPDTASRVLEETLPLGAKPLQVLTMNETARSVHGASYTRLPHLELLAIIREFATDFTPPQEAMGGGTGLYCGEQDMFCFLIDPTGWTEIDGQAFCPGFFLWNSEVGRRSLGLQTFWFQAVCQNHIVWDAVEVVDFSRKHTANVRDSLSEVRRILARLVEKRDARKDGFARVMKKAMEETLGSDADEVMKVMTQKGVPKELAKEALVVAKEAGRFTIFALVDAMTRIAGRMKNVGDRTDVDEKASALLALAA